MTSSYYDNKQVNMQLCTSNDLNFFLDGRISGEKIVLGRFESDQIFNHTNLIDEFVDRKQTLYHSQFYTNGSLCNLNSKLRKTEARVD